MTKPVRDHPNVVRILIRKIMPAHVWKLIFCRYLYKKNLQKVCVVWFAFFVLLVTYCLFNGLYLINKINKSHPNDTSLKIMVDIVTFSSIYLAIVSMALEVMVMMIVMLLMTAAVILCFFWFIFCPRCMSYQPQDNSMINREYFLTIINGNGTWEQVLQYLYKHKRRHFKASRYDWVHEDNKLEEEKESSKDDRVNSQKDGHKEFDPDFVGKTLVSLPTQGNVESTKHDKPQGNNVWSYCRLLVVHALTCRPHFCIPSII